MDKIRTKVTLAGQNFYVTGNGDEDYVKQLEQMVNARIHEVSEAYPSLGANHCALLAMLNLADEYMQLKSSTEQIDAKLAQLRGMPRIGSQAQKSASSARQDEPVGV